MIEKDRWKNNKKKNKTKKIFQKNKKKIKKKQKKIKIKKKKGKMRQASMWPSWKHGSHVDVWLTASNKDCF